MSLSTLLVLVVFHIPFIVWVNRSPRSFVRMMRWLGPALASAGFLLAVYAMGRFEPTALDGRPWYAVALSMVVIGLGTHILGAAIHGVPLAAGAQTGPPPEAGKHAPPSFGLIALVIVLFGIGLQFLSIIVHAVQGMSG